MKEVIERFRKTVCYKIAGWVGLVICPIILFLLLWGIFNAGRLELAALALFVVISFLVYGFLLEFLALCTAAIVQVIVQYKKDMSNKKTNIIADVGFIVSLILIIILILCIVLSIAGVVGLSLMPD